MSEPRIVVFDVETTGTDKQRDQIIELCVQFGLDDDAHSQTWRIKPQVAISPGAQEVHGISMAELADCLPFADVADEVRALFADTDMLVGYNLRFDIDMLQAEYLRLRQPPLDLADKFVVDPFRLWQQCEPRSLMDAHRRFVGADFESAHSASADVAATGRVLRGMVESFALTGDWQSIADICEPDRAFWIGGSKHLRWSEEGRVVLGFGKHADIPLAELARGPDAGYLRWVLSKDFAPHVLETVKKALDMDAADFDAWATDTFPAPKVPVSPRAAAQSSGGGGEAAGKSTSIAGGDGIAEREDGSPAQQSLFP